MKTRSGKIEKTPGIDKPKEDLKNIKLVIEYDGTDFCGWQIQPNERTVQGTIEIALKELFSESIKLIGAGRTDQGVHARGQTANFITDTTLPLSKIKTALNSLTDPDINIIDTAYVDNDFHSRFSAKSKTYQYNMMFRSSPFELRYHWLIKHKLDTKNMLIARDCLMGKHDFKYFSTETEKENTVCDITSINLTEHKSRIIINIDGDRFIRKMVRGIVGFLYDVGRGYYKPDQTQDALTGNIKKIFFAPPQGLFLIKVTY